MARMVIRNGIAWPFSFALALSLSLSGLFVIPVSGAVRPPQARVAKQVDKAPVADLALRVETAEGAFVVFDAVTPEGDLRDGPAYLVYWHDARAREVYVFDRPVRTPADVGRALIDLDRDFAVDAAAIAARADWLPDARAEGHSRSADGAIWLVATRNSVLQAMGFEPIVPEEEDWPMTMSATAGCWTCEPPSASTLPDGGEPWDPHRVQVADGGISPAFSDGVTPEMSPLEIVNRTLAAIACPPSWSLICNCPSCSSPPPPPTTCTPSCACCYAGTIAGSEAVPCCGIDGPAYCNDCDPCTVNDICADPCPEGYVSPAGFGCCGMPMNCDDGDNCTRDRCDNGACVHTPQTDPNDLDCDGIPNGEDDDVDGDGILNGDDDDVDGDGILNGDDDDVDGDGILNGDDGDVDGDGFPNESDPDIDGDGISNDDDNDADGDGFPNNDDPSPEGCTGSCCGSTDPCCGSSNPCCGRTDPCCGVDCDDGDFCNGIETCQGGACVRGTPVNCDDGYFCNGVETCVGGVCFEGTPPPCADEDICTLDSCSPTGCENLPICLEGQTCCGEYCCPREQTCCGAACCLAGEPCCNGTCCSGGLICCDGQVCCCPPVSSADAVADIVDLLRLSPCTNACTCPGTESFCLCLNRCRLSECLTGWAECTGNAGFSLGLAEAACAVGCLPAFTAGGLATYKTCGLACAIPVSLIPLVEAGYCLDQLIICQNSANDAFAVCISNTSP